MIAGAAPPASPTGPRAAVIVPTWNGARHLPTCLAALRGQVGGALLPGFDPARDMAVLVVVNGSNDDTDAVLARHPEVGALRLPVNRGFAGGVNAGIRATRAPVVALLNDDTEVAPTWLAALLAALAADPGAGAATSKVRLFDRRDRLHTTGDTVDVRGLAANRGVWELDEGQYDDAREVFGASAAAAAYRRALFEDVGLFEEGFGSYYEDVDLAVRARLAGWRAVYIPEALVYHKLSATGGGPYASYRVARNRVWTLARCWPRGLLLRHGPAIVRAQLALAADAARHARGAAARATLAGLVVGWLTWPRWLGARRRIQRARRVDDATLARWLGVGSGVEDGAEAAVGAVAGAGPTAGATEGEAAP